MAVDEITPISRNGRPPAREHRGLPHDIETESILLGSLLLRSDLVGAVASLETEDFYHPYNQVVFEAIRNMPAEAVSVVSVGEALEARDAELGTHKFENLGGFAYLGLLVTCAREASSIDPTDVLDAERILRALSAARRKMISDAEIEAIADRDREAPPRTYWNAPDLVDEILKHANDPWISLKLGPDEIARVRAGGTAVVIGGSGSGKSSFVSNILVDHARNVGPAIAVSIELPADELAARIIGIKCDESWEDVLRGKLGRQFMVEALAMPRLYVLERKFATLANLRRVVADVRAKHGNEPILVAIDYAQLVASPEREARMKVTDAFGQIDDAARDLRIVAIAVSQMSRASAKQARSGDKIGAEAADLGAESAAIERYASVTITIGMAGEPDEHGARIVELSIGKGRMTTSDLVYKARYWGRSGLWRTETEAQPASVVREARETDKQEKEKTSAENALVGAASRATAPMTRDDLMEAVPGRRPMLRAIIKKLLLGGEIVEVNQRAPRTKYFKVWTAERATAAGVQLATSAQTGWVT